MRDTAAALAAAVMGMAVVHASAPQAPGDVRRAEIRVGIEEGDFRGADNRALQMAVDYVAGLGGGTVHVAPGRYTMRNALKLRDNVRVIGIPGKTVLAACDGARSLLACDGDCNERQITLADPGAFRVGDGVAIADTASGGGFAVTTATLTAQVDRNTFSISAPLYLDYMIAQKAAARLVFPVVGGWQVKNVVLEGLTIDGNREKSESLDGCRGGGIYLFESENVTIRNCVVRGYNGDGISFQVSSDVKVEECLSEKNAGLGLHPGSGSQRPILRGNRSVGNGSDGLYVCWRVKHGLFENNEIRDNLRAGISIGHKDTDNLFRNNTITGNARAGVLFRSESEPMAAHRNVFEKNTILDNATAEKEDAARAAIVIRGPHHDLVFRDNTIGLSKPANASAVGIRSNPEAQRLQAAENRFLNIKTPVEAGK
jgi:parallel beta-helix repeat protein